MERALRIIYQDHRSSFIELPAQDNSLTVHRRNLRCLVTEMFKVKIGITPKIMNDIFKRFNSYYNLRDGFILKSYNVHKVTYGTEAVSFLGPRLWKTLLKCCKSVESLKVFN